MPNCITVKDLTHLHALQNHEENEYVYVEKTKEIYQWSNEEYHKVEIKNKGVEMNLYDLNKNIINQMKPMTQGEFYDKANDIIFDLFITKPVNYYFMLLCKEYNYYTIFAPGEMDKVEEDFVSAVLGIVEELGPVYEIERTEGSIEFWIKPEGCEEPMIFILFPYDAGVVYYI